MKEQEASATRAPAHLFGCFCTFLFCSNISPIVLEDEMSDKIIILETVFPLWSSINRKPNKERFPVVILDQCVTTLRLRGES